MWIFVLVTSSKNFLSLLILHCFLIVEFISSIWTVLGTNDCSRNGDSEGIFERLHWYSLSIFPWHSPTLPLDVHFWRYVIFTFFTGMQVREKWSCKNRKLESFIRKWNIGNHNLFSTSNLGTHLFVLPYIANFLLSKDSLPMI